MKRTYLTYFLLALSAFCAGARASVQLSMHSVTVNSGQSIYVSVYADSSLTGLHVTSYQLAINIPASVATLDSAYSTGTLTSGWGSPAYHLSNVSGYSQISVAGAGTTALTGTGALVTLKITAPATQYNQAGYLTFVNAQLNEGAPADTTVNGYLYVYGYAAIQFYPNTALMTVGDTLPIGISGGTLPYTLMTINANSVVHALSPGFCNVIARDSTGLTDTSGTIEVRAFILTMTDTSTLQGDTIDVPVYTSDLSQVHATSGQFTVTFNQSVLTALGVTTTGSILNGFGTVTAHPGTGQISVSFAGSSALSTVGKKLLLHVRFVAVNTGGVYLTFSNILFNENIPGNGGTNYLSVGSNNSLYVSPSTAMLVAGQTQQFSVNGSPTGPVTWSISNNAIATISGSGLLTALHGGWLFVNVVDSIGNTGKSDTIHLYDMTIGAQNTPAAPNDIIDVPIVIPASPSGVTSIQFLLTFDTTFTAQSLSTIGDLTNGWGISSSIMPGSVNIAMASATPITGPGTVITVRFSVSAYAQGTQYTIMTTNALINEGNPAVLGIQGLVTVYNAPPAQPTLSSPANGATNVPVPAALSWNAAYQAVNYRVQVSTDSLFGTTAFDSSGITIQSASAHPLLPSTKYFWRVQGVNPFGGTWSIVWSFTTQASTGVRDGKNGLPTTYALDQNYPNPFNPTTTISYALPQNAHVSLKVYNVLGELVATVADGYESAGYKTARLDAQNLPSGIYLYRLQAGNFSAVKKIVVMK